VDQLEALKGIAGAYERQPLSRAPTLSMLAASSGFNNEASPSATAIVVAHRYIALSGAIAIPGAIRGSVNESTAGCLWSDIKFCLDNNTELYLMSVPTERIVQTCIEFKNLNRGSIYCHRNYAGRRLAGSTTSGFEFASELKQRGQGGSKQWQLEK
jgi:hypothetical protein